MSQTLKVPGTPACKIIVGDCRETMKAMRPNSFDLIFADPPFNQGEPYSTWKDTLPGREYRKFTEEWLDAAVPLLSGRGNFWVNCPDELAARVVIRMEDVHGLTLRDWCIWHYRFGQCKDSGFIKSKAHALHFVRDAKNYIWNPDAVLVESDRASKYNDPRTQESSRPGKRVPLDVWGVGDTFDPAYPGDGAFWGRVQGNNQERNPGHPNQLPERYIERVVRSSSNADSVVFTPFAGSGTELVVARALGRVSLGCEIGEKEANSAFERIKRGSVRVTA